MCWPIWSGGARSRDRAGPAQSSAEEPSFFLASSCLRNSSSNFSRRGEGGALRFSSKDFRRASRARSSGLPLDESPGFVIGRLFFIRLRFQLCAACCPTFRGQMPEQASVLRKFPVTCRCIDLAIFAVSRFCNPLCRGRVFSNVCRRGLESRNLNSVKAFGTLGAVSCDVWYTLQNARNRAVWPNRQTGSAGRARRTLRSLSGCNGQT